MLIRTGQNMRKATYQECQHVTITLQPRPCGTSSVSLIRRYHLGNNFLFITSSFRAIPPSLRTFFFRQFVCGLCTVLSTGFLSQKNVLRHGGPKGSPLFPCKFIQPVFFIIHDPVVRPAVRPKPHDCYHVYCCWMMMMMMTTIYHKYNNY